MRPPCAPSLSEALAGRRSRHALAEIRSLLAEAPQGLPPVERRARLARVELLVSQLAGADAQAIPEIYRILALSEEDG